MATLPKPRTRVRGRVRPAFGVRVSGMWIVTPEQAKANLPQVLEHVSRRRNFVVIDRNGKPGAILVKADERWKATIEIISDPEFMASIRRGLRQAEGGRFVSEREVEELLGPDRRPRARRARRRR